MAKAVIFGIEAGEYQNWDGDVQCDNYYEFKASTQWLTMFPEFPSQVLSCLTIDNHKRLMEATDDTLWHTGTNQVFLGRIVIDKAHIEKLEYGEPL